MKNFRKRSFGFSKRITVWGIPVVVVVGDPATINPPVLVISSVPHTVPMTFNSIFDNTVYDGYQYHVQVATDSSFTNITQDFVHDLGGGEVSSGDIDLAYDGFVQPPIGTYYLRVRIERDDGIISAWSNTIIDEIYDFIPNSFSLVDQTEIAANTVVLSNIITVSGVSLGAQIPISVTGGEYQINAGSWVSTAGIVLLNDTVRVRQTSSPTGNTKTDCILNIGGLTDTFSATTADPAALLPLGSSLGMWLEASPSNLYQNIAASTTVAADGDLVGTWIDKSANNFHLSAVADNATRPVFRTNAGVSYVDFDGVDDILRRLSALNLWSASGYTAMIALRSNGNTVNKSLMGQGNSASSNTIFSIAHSSAGTASTETSYYRNDAGVDVLNSTQVTNMFDGTDSVLTIIDTGSSIQVWKDAVAGTTRTYTRGANAITMDRFSLGGLIRNIGTGGLFFASRVHGVAIWPGVQLNSVQRAQALTRFGSLQGRTI